MGSVSNPSHLLISRNPPRSPAHPQLAPTSTSPQHVNTWRPPRDASGSSEDDQDESEADNEESVEIDLTFRKEASWPGTVKVLVGASEFWCHKDILVFGSPFFQSLLLGDWAETTTTRASFSSSISVPRSQFTFTSDGAEPSVDPSSITEHVEDEIQAPVLALEGLDLDSAVDTPKESIYHDAPQDDFVPALPVRSVSEGGLISTTAPEDYTPKPTRSTSSDSTLLQPTSDVLAAPIARDRSRKRKRSKRNLQVRGCSSTHPRKNKAAAVATVDLVDEKASVFQDFLRWIYPNLDCKITWTNVEGLYTISDRLINNSLKQAAHSFLMTHASGKPLTAMNIAELHDNAELYREASRFVLDLGAWVEEDMAVLSDKTRMKLLMRRNWFLDRLVKLQATDVRREYQCHPSCPDLANCQRLLDDKWRLAQATLSRYGSPQPSVAFRCLRLLETYPTNPSLLLTHTVCQNTAKAWVMSLFDRMFQPRHSFPAGTEKYWLFVTLN